MAYQLVDLVGAMQKDAGIVLQNLRVDGGASVNDKLLQFQSDLLGVNVLRPRVAETTALGAAYLAGLAAGFWSDLADIARHWALGSSHRPFQPSNASSSAGGGVKRSAAPLAGHPREERLTGCNSPAIANASNQPYLVP